MHKKTATASFEFHPKLSASKQSALDPTEGPRRGAQGSVIEICVAIVWLSILRNADRLVVAVASESECGEVKSKRVGGESSARSSRTNEPWVMGGKTKAHGNGSSRAVKAC